MRYYRGYFHKLAYSRGVAERQEEWVLAFEPRESQRGSEAAVPGAHGTTRFFVFGDHTSSGTSSGAWVRERPTPERPPTYCVFGIYYYFVTIDLSDYNRQLSRELLLQLP